VHSRSVFLATVLASTLSAQFSGLSATADGSSVYFASKLRLKGSAGPLNRKIFVSTGEAVKLFRAREPVGPVAALPPTCTVSGFADYSTAETSSAGVSALLYRASSAGSCSFPGNTFITDS